MLRRMILLAAMALAAVVPSAADAGRKALVIGNAAYAVRPLANPVNDANDMASKLKSLGFSVTLATNTTRNQMAAAILAFQRELAAGDEALVFYAGHGVQVAGANWLIPVDADPQSEAAVEFAAIDLNRVLRTLQSAGTRVNLVLLDACRDNPFEGRFRGGSRGLARVEMAAASGTLVSYAAAPGTVAADGRSRNSPYTAAWLTALNEPGLTHTDILERVHVAVKKATGDVQTTWQEGQIIGRLVFNEARVSPPAPVPQTPQTPAAGDDMAVELAFWNSIKDSQDKRLFEVYLERYPNGAFAPLARLRIESQAPQPTPAQPGAASAVTVELAFWNSIKDSNSKRLYEVYLDRYPTGAFVSLAKLKLEELGQGQGSPQRPATTPDRTGIVVAELDTMMRTTGRTNVRSGPGTEYDRVAQLEGNEPINVTGQVRDREWYRVALAGGGTGYVHGSLLEQMRQAPPAPTPAYTPTPVPAGPTAGTVFRDCDVCPEMVVVPAGRFAMGSPNSEAGRWDDEGPQTNVNVARAYAIGVYEITDDEYEAYWSTTGRGARPACKIWDGDKYVEDSNAVWFDRDPDHPVVCTSWFDAKDYVAWLARRTGKPYRLPSEAEWEYAARGGTSTTYPWGSDVNAVCNYANVADTTGKGVKTDWTDVVDCDDGWVGTSPVGMYDGNRFGVYDMIGNVSEWVEDCAFDNFNGRPTDASARQVSGECKYRVKRGAHWHMGPQRVRSAFRNWEDPGLRHNGTGFRVALDVTAATVRAEPVPTPAPTTGRASAADVAYIRGLPGGGEGEWDRKVGARLLQLYDADRSDKLDTVAEVDAIGCDVWQAINASYRASGKYTSEFGYLYGFDGSSWLADSLGFVQRLQAQTYAAMQRCGLK
ncbi:MAG: SUMF1/EgtB/PvdO family nonheme iron enzyme [Alphaproteobacteria bacterium]